MLQYLDGQKYSSHFDYFHDQVISMSQGPWVMRHMHCFDSGVSRVEDLRKISAHFFDKMMI